MSEKGDRDPDRAVRHALVKLLPRLRRFCLALTASSADADDLCQSTCERAITRLDYWTPGTRLDSWLFRIAQNLHKNTIRDHGNRLRLLEEQVAISPELTEAQRLPAADDPASELQRHVLALPPAEREVLILICVEGYSYKECAALLDLPETTVTNRLFKARMHLRKEMEEDLPIDAVTKRSASA